MNRMQEFRFVKASGRKMGECLKNAARFIALLIFFLACFSFPSRASFEFNSNCQQALLAVLDLRFRDARAMIDEEREDHPGNGYAIYLEHYSEAIELVITEDQSIYKRMIDSYPGRIASMDQLDTGSPDNEWLQAQMLFHLGLAQIKFGTRISGASKIFSSYRQIRQHREEHPEFWQNQMLTGIYNILFDYIPPFMRWAADMFGFTGNSELGLYQMTRYCEKAAGTPGLAEEAVAFTNLCYKLTNREEEGFRFLSEQDKKYFEIVLVKYLYANAAIYSYQNELALNLLEEIRQDDLQVDFYGLAYVTGRSKLNRLDRDANLELEKYLRTYPGSDYKKDACNRLSYYYLLQGNMAKYREYRSEVALVGQDLRDRDREAILESNSPVVPDTTLLKARLLFDGGYFDRALSTLQSVDVSLLKDTYHKAEYHYRMGRVLELKSRFSEAIPELTEAYDLGRSLPYTFSTRAALYLGKIYEDKKEYRTAALWYERCMDVYSPEHTTEGVKDAAERGSKRLKGKS